jgi:putative membrane protein
LNNFERSNRTESAIVAGVLGGLAGTLAMNYAQRLWTRAADGEAPTSAGGKHDARDWQEREEGRNANELAAQTIATTVGTRPLTNDELAVAAPLAHYSFGAALGALYGCCIRDDQQDVFRRGAAFGAAVWLLADEVAMPLLRLSRPTTERSLEKHLQSFATHIVFGTVAELIRAQTIPLVLTARGVPRQRMAERRVRA